MRKQFDGLASLAQSKLQCQASSGELFAFINRKRTLIKVLYYRRGGFCLWSKRLERGGFHRVQGEGNKIPLTEVQLQCLIEGINWQKLKTSQRYR